MEKLTKEQEVKLEKKRISLIEKNGHLLFDIKHTIEVGHNLKKELDELNETNQNILDTQKEKCLSDFNKLQDFLGKYKSLVTMVDHNKNNCTHSVGVDNFCSENHFQFKIGKDENAIWVTYTYLREWWSDAGNFSTIGGKDYPHYYAEDLEAWSEDLDVESFTSIEQLCSDKEYGQKIEKALIQHIIE